MIQLGRQLDRTMVSSDSEQYQTYTLLPLSPIVQPVIFANKIYNLWMRPTTLS